MIFLFELFMAAIIFFPLNSNALTPNIINRTTTKVVCIESTFPNGEEKVGTGFFLDDDLIATVAHQVNGSIKNRIHFIDGTRMDAQIRYKDVEKDIALIQIPKGKNHGYIPLSENIIPKIGIAVFTIGCPYGLEMTLNQGTVSYPNRIINGQVLIQADLTVHDGNSGGPLMDKDGHVIGIVRGVHPNSNKISFSIPITPLRLFLAEVYYSQGLEYLKEDKLSTAIMKFQKAVNFRPDFYQAYTNLGAVLYVTNQPKAAEQALLKAIEIDANFPLAFYHLGNVYARGLSNINSAKVAYERFLEINKNADLATEVRKWMKTHKN